MQWPSHEKLTLIERIIYRSSAFLHDLIEAGIESDLSETAVYKACKEALNPTFGVQWQNDGDARVFRPQESDTLLLAENNNDLFDALRAAGADDTEEGEVIILSLKYLGTFEGITSDHFVNYFNDKIFRAQVSHIFSLSDLSDSASKDEITLLCYVLSTDKLKLMTILDFKTCLINMQVAEAIVANLQANHDFLKLCNFLSNKMSDEIAHMLVNAVAQRKKPISLCGIVPSKDKVVFDKHRPRHPLYSHDAILLASDLSHAPLTQLRLESNQIGFTGAQAIGHALEKNPFLHILIIRHDKTMGSQGVAAIADGLLKNDSLTTLDLSMNDTGPECAQNIAEMIIQNTSLTSLDFSNNGLHDGAIPIAQALPKNHTLTRLSLHDNELDSPEAVEAIALGLATNDSLKECHLRTNQMDFSVIFRALTNNPVSKIATWGLCCGETVSAKALADYIKSTTLLTNLDLNNNRLKDAVDPLLLALRTANCSLSELNIADIDINSTAPLYEMLSANTSITSLTLGDNPLGEKGFINIFKGLTENRTLKTLDLKNTTAHISVCVSHGDNSIFLGPEGAASLAEAIPQMTLTSLNLSGHDLCGVVGGTYNPSGILKLARALNSSVSLMDLDLTNNAIQDEDALAIVEADNLVSLSLDDNPVTNKVSRRIKERGIVTRSHFEANPQRAIAAAAARGRRK